MVISSPCAWAGDPSEEVRVERQGNYPYGGHMRVNLKSDGGGPFLKVVKLDQQHKYANVYIS